MRECPRSAVTILLAILLAPATALAGDIWGGDHNAAAAWWKCNDSPPPGEVVSCCSEADGHVLSDKEWTITEDDSGNRHYRVRVHPPGKDTPFKWEAVPDKVVIRPKCGAGPTPADATAAKAWWANVEWGVNSQFLGARVLCFMPVVLY